VPFEVTQENASALEPLFEPWEEPTMHRLPNPERGRPAVIAPAEEKAPSLGGQYVGQDFVLRLRWRPQGLSGPDRVRWLLYRQAPTPVQADRVVLWIKQAP